MSNFWTMLLVVGGTFLAGGVLLYLSLLPDRPRSTNAKRNAAAETTAILAAAQDPGAGENRK